MNTRPHERRIRLRPVELADLEPFFAHQADPVACELAGFASRERDAFFEHWKKILADSSGLLRTVVADGVVAGNVVAWGARDERNVGYWIARELWGRGIATRALAQFVEIERTRPLFAHVALHNVASRRVLAKCGFVEVAGSVELVDAVEELVMRLDGSSREA